MAKLQTNPKMQTELPFPLEGIDETRSYLRQRTGTSADEQNVRSFEPSTDRQRGGSRSGTEKYFETRAVADSPIQGIGHLVTNDAAVPASTVGEFVYGLASGSGFGLANGTTGASAWTAGAESGYGFSCSCWDDDGYVYVATIKTGDNPAPCKIRKILASTGVVAWTSTIFASPFLTTGSLRKIAGMVVIGDSLYVATVKPTGTTNAIHKIAIATGLTTTGSWYSSADSATLIFSTASINCLGKVGTLLGVECRATSNSQCFKIIDTAKTAATFKAAVITRAYTGTGANNRSVVVSDNIAYFYVLTSCTTNIVKKIGTSGVIEWNSTVFDSAGCQGIAYDKSLGHLVGVTTSSPSLSRLSLTLGSQVSTADPGTVTQTGTTTSGNKIITGLSDTTQLSVGMRATGTGIGAAPNAIASIDSSTQVTLSVNSSASATVSIAFANTSWNWIDSDNHGYWTLYKDSKVGGDVLGINSTFTTVWGPLLFANTTHSGASVNKGVDFVTPVAGAAEIRRIGVCNGTVFTFSRDGAQSITNGASLSPSAKHIFMAQFGQDMYFADGQGYWKLVSTTNALTQWTATAGAMPSDDLTGKARLICNFLDRCVLGGFVRDPRILYFSAIGFPDDWDTAPSPPSPSQAFADYLEDSITSLIRYQDDVMIVGTDHKIIQYTSDPGLGGAPDEVSGQLGMAWGRSHAISPDNQIYFYGSQGGIYKMVPGASPVPAGQQIKRRLENIDLSTHTINMCWDIKNIGVGLWITPFDATKDGINFFLEARTNAWHPDFYTRKEHCVTAAHLLDGDDPNDLAILLGCRDGHIRILSDSAELDDGHPIDSWVLMGPIRTPLIDDIILLDMQATLGEDSNDVRYDVYVGKTPEAALASMYAANGDIAPGVRYGTLRASRNHVSDVNFAGFSIFVKISSSKRWVMEKITARYMATGMVRRRSG